MRDVVGQSDRGSIRWIVEEVREVDAMASSKDVDICRGEGAAGSAVREGLGQVLPCEWDEDMD